MADPRVNFCNQEYQHREQPKTRDDYIAYAQANANYCYQLSLWWWNACNGYNQHTRTPSWDRRFTDENCECTERTMIVEGDCDCFQNNAGCGPLCETPRDEVNSCKDCPEGVDWCRLNGGVSSSSGNHYGMIFQQNCMESYGADNNACGVGEEDCDNDDDNDDEDDIYDDNTGNDNGDDDGDDNDYESDTNMEVDDDFRKFLEQSEKHRQERERRKQEILEEKDDYIEVGSIHLNTTTCAPSEQPGAKRKEEMNALYGKHAPLIMSLEASLQLNYDKNCDMRQPIFWPSIPLKF